MDGLVEVEIPEYTKKEVIFGSILKVGGVMLLSVSIICSLIISYVHTMSIIGG